MMTKRSILFYLALVFSCSFYNCKSTTVPAWSHFDSTVFVKAKKEHKLVLLHLRANWCHWCHVMEEKTYADPSIISYLKQNYIACSEDHDERQDLTSLYSEYGWPATIIFDENGNELFKEAGYIETTEFLATLTQLRKNPRPLANDVILADVVPTSASVKQQSLDKLKNMFRNTLDIDEGGFSFPQKFIDFETFEYALTHYQTDTILKQWLRTTVVNSIGIYDTVWGGVYQYSTNGDWEHAHFEKLLSRQATYIKIYCWYYKVFNDAEALKKAEGIAAYVNRFLSAANGGFYNAQDADLIPGEKAKAYFELNDEQRMRKGIPAIDSNVYTSDNAQFAEALTILWATTGNQTYLNKAVKCVEFLNAQRKVKGAYMHGGKYTATISLKDNVTMVKTLLLLYRTTQNTDYKTEAAQLAKTITSTFNSGKGYFYTYIGNSAIKATYNVSENIEACRVLNYCAHFFDVPDYKTTATAVMDFLTNEQLVHTYSTEPGILSAAEELNYEPINAALLLKKGDALKADYIATSISFPRFYFNSSIYTKETITEDKKDLFESLDGNCIVLCTSSYCSAPMFNQKDFVTFLYKRVFANK